MIDLDCMIKYLRLAWLQRIYNVTKGPWKWYLSRLLTKFGGLFLFNCNYDVNDLSVVRVSGRCSGRLCFCKRLARYNME